MKIVKYSYLDNKIKYGKVSGRFIKPMINSIYDDELLFEKKSSINLNDCKLYLPINSSKIIGVAQNFRKKNQKNDPLFFLKTSNSLCLENSKIQLPKKSNTWGESELAFVIKKKINKKITLEKCKSYILGYVLANDITASYNNGHDHHLALSKSLNNFCPISNFIETNFNFKNKIIEGFHNNQLIRRANTSKFIFNPHQILSFLSGLIELNPGDLILTGAPPRVIERKYLKKYDKYTVKIESLGQITNSFK